MSYISHRLSLFDSSDFRNAIQKQQLLENPIDLSIGIPEELTPEHIKAAGIHAIQSDKTTYTPANGLLELRQALAYKLHNENRITCNEHSVTVVPGLTTGQLLVYLAILDPGDELVVFDPYYPPYPHLASMTGAQVVFASTLPDFQPDIESLEAIVTHKTKAIVVNSPNNPTGAIYPEETLRKIAIIAEKYNILIISDEIYEHFIFKGSHFSIGSIYPNTITMNGFSKEYAMTGWRVGYIAGPQEIINAINELQQYVIMSSSSIAQHAALEAIKHPPSPNLAKKYSTKRDLMRETLESFGIKIEGGDGAFYLFAKAPGGMTDLEFVEKATEHDLILVPGRAFSQSHGFFRLSYGAELPTLHRAKDALTKLMQSIEVTV